MSRRVTEIEELKTMINSFRCSDLVSLLGSVGGNRSGRKNELQARALEILSKSSSSVNVEAFKRKVRELYKAAQDEAKQSHNLDLQQQIMTHNMPGRMQHVIAPQHANAMQQQRPISSMNHFGVPTQTYHHQPQRGNFAGANTAVYQGGVSGISGATYPGANIYNQSNAQAMQISQNTCNLGTGVMILSPNYLATASNVKFRKLPFYNVKHEIIRPAILTANSHSTLLNAQRTSATQEFHFSFVLSCEMASDMAMNRDISNGKNEYNIQAQLRITAYDNATNNVVEYDDFLPLGLAVRLNHKPCTLPICSPNSRTGTETRRIPRPINVTQHMKMSPINANHLIINWALETGKTFVITLNLVEKLSSEYLLNKLKERPKISVDITKATIREQYKRVIDDDDDNDEANEDDDDIATTIVRVSLVCPLAKFRMMYPAKGKNCSHLQCFDGSAYISLNEKKPMWMCPVCNRALYFDDLLIDQYFLDVLQNDQLSPDCQEVQLLVDGTWKSYDEEASSNDDKPKSGTSANSPAAPSPSASNTEANDGESIEIVSNEDCDKKDNALVEGLADANAAAGGPVVDLTEEEEESRETMDVASNDDEAPADNEASKTVSPIPTPPAPSHRADTNEENISETSSNAQNKDEETVLPPRVTTPASASAPADAAAAVSSSGYLSPNNIISLDSPSPPSTTPPSPPNTLAALNIGGS